MTTRRGQAEEVTDILVRSKRGIVTAAQLQDAIEAYQAMLPNPEYLYTKVQTFNGLIRYIYNHIIKNILPNTYNYDYELLDNIFHNIYIPLCSSYGFIPNTLLFCNLCNITEDYIYLKSNDNDTEDVTEKTNKRKNISIIKGWTREAESALRSQVADHSSIGSMFLLKSKFGYRENDVLTVQVDADAPRLDLKQISQAARAGYIAPPEE